VQAIETRVGSIASNLAGNKQTWQHQVGDMSQQKRVGPGGGVARPRQTRHGRQDGDSLDSLFDGQRRSYKAGVDSRCTRTCSMMELFRSRVEVGMCMRAVE
jgi:hypothetical protein